MNVELRPVSLPHEIDLARALFREYADGLKVDLCFQGFASELEGLPGSYAPPAGRLILAWVGNEAVGCAALRPLAPGVGEVKRLFVRPGFRRHGIARRLCRRILDDARSIGYATLRLDTLEEMVPAIRLYESLGFIQVGPYYETPLPHTVFMAREL